MYRLILLVLIFTMFAGPSRASHILGGSACYEFIQHDIFNDLYIYKIKMELYRDMGGVNLPTSFDVKIFEDDSSYTFWGTTQISLVDRDTVTFYDFAPPLCNLDFYNFKFQVYYMEGTVGLPPSQFGYWILWETCCRNLLADNLIQNEGYTNWTYIPATADTNNSPCYWKPPALFVCRDVSTSFDFSRTEIDGDSLYYWSITPFDSNSTAPILNIVSYSSPFYSAKYPFGLKSSFTIDNSTGQGTILADSIGAYVVAIEVKEFRNGEVLSNTIIDQLFIVIDCYSFTTLDSFYCDNYALVDLQGYPSGGNFTGPGIIGNKFHPSNAGTGLVTIKYSKDGCALADSQTTYIAAAPDPAIYQNGYVLSTDQGYSYQWLLGNDTLHSETNQSITVMVSGKYTIEVTDSNGCKGWSNVYVDTSLLSYGFDPNSKLLLYPNPVDDHLNIEGSIIPDIEVRISNMHGQQVYKTPTNIYKQSIDVSNLSPGLYFIEFIFKDGKVTKKFLVN